MPLQLSLRDYALHVSLSSAKWTQSITYRELDPGHDTNVINNDPFTVLSIYIRDVERTSKLYIFLKQNYINNGNNFTQIWLKCDYVNIVSIIQIDRFSKYTWEDKLEKMFKCQYCTLKMIRKHCLEERTRKHIRDMLNCSHCRYETGKSSYLEAHLRKHTGGFLKC